MLTYSRHLLALEQEKIDGDAHSLSTWDDLSSVSSSHENNQSGMVRLIIPALRRQTEEDAWALLGRQTSLNNEIPANEKACLKGGGECS